MSRSEIRARRWAAIAGGLLAGYAGTKAKGLAEAWGQPRAEQVWPPTEKDKEVPGADPADHPENMPPAVIATRALTMLTGHAPDDDVRDRVGAGIHWAIGLGSALAYTFVARRVPAAGRLLGAPAGLVLYAATHGTLVPAMKVQPPPWRMPTAAVVWEAGSHVVYLMAVESTWRGLRAFSRHW